MLINTNLPKKSMRVVVRLAGVSLVALSLAFQVPVEAAENGRKPAVKAKPAAKKNKAASAKAVKLKAAKSAKIKAAMKKHLKHPHARKAAPKSHAGRPAKVVATRAGKKIALVAPKQSVSNAGMSMPIKPAGIAVAKPVIAKSTRTMVDSPAVPTENSLPPPEFRIATSACQRDGKVYLMAGCDNKELPEVLTANPTKVDAR